MLSSRSKTRVTTDSAHQGILHVKFERVIQLIINSVPLMDLYAKSNLTLKLKMLKVKVKDKGRNG